MNDQPQIDLSKFKKTHHQLARPLLVISGSKGCLTCGYLSMDSFERNGDAGAIVRGVDNYEEMLVAKVKAVSSLAAELGAQVGMTGAEVLELFE